MFRCPDLNCSNYTFNSRIHFIKEIQKHKANIDLLPFSCAPDEIRTHIDGTGNHNSIR